MVIMGKPKKKSRKREKSIVHRLTVPSKTKSIETPQSLLAQATELLHTSQPEEAARLAEHALAALRQTGSEPAAALPALTVLGEACVELGEIDRGRSYFLQAVEVDPEGAAPEDGGGGAEKFLWLAQLCEEGGETSVDWYERGIRILRRQIQEREDGDPSTNAQFLEEKRDKLAKALCGIAEVYMTDLSWEEDAESKCESVVTEAVAVSPNSPEPLQTLASVRISQLRMDDAKAALEISMKLWKDLPPEDPNVPDFPTRISLARLLLETEMEEEAMDVLERLINDDDQSVEAWYLGGWALYLMGQKTRQTNKDGGAEWKVTWRSSREWLENSLKLYDLLDYEDDRLKDHAQELVRELSQVVDMQAAEDNDGEAADEEWEDDSDASDVDEVMGGT